MTTWDLKTGKFPYDYSAESNSTTIQYTDDTTKSFIIPSFTTSNANNNLKVDASGTFMEWGNNQDFGTINCDKIIFDNKGTVTDPAIKFNTNMGIYQVTANNAINFTDGNGGTSCSFLQDSSKTVQFNNITCSTINTPITINGSITTQRLILNTSGTTSNPQIVSNDTIDPPNKSGINLSDNNCSIITEGNIASTFANGQINFYKPCIILYEQNPWNVQANSLTVSNTTSKVLKLNYTNNDVTLTLANTSDGHIIQVYPFKTTSGSFSCFLTPSSNTISTYFGGVKTNVTSGTISIIEGYRYDCVFQSSINTWYVTRSG